jgi:hypothetical protein
MAGLPFVMLGCPHGAGVMGSSKNKAKQRRQNKTNRNEKEELEMRKKSTLKHASESAGPLGNSGAEPSCA